ncbi:MAG: ATP-binding protein [Clostridia bacterium]|nr:ATP-binding protein [Clostridia bacterium]
MNHGANVIEQTDSRVGGGGAATSAGIQFEKRLGALIGSWLLNQQPMPAFLGLGDAVPIWMRFETEAPVDDILVATSAGGYVAIQAKTTASLSSDLTSPFGKTVSQFVRHWLTCRDGAGTFKWDRPLDPNIDRLVLAVGSNAPSSITRTLADALRLASQPGGGVLNDAQSHAFSTFAVCVEQAWVKATAGPYQPELAKTLAGLIRVFPFDSAAMDQAIFPTAISLDSSNLSNTRLLATSLEALCGELMAQRGGVDLPALRQSLFARGLKLASPPSFRSDIARLRAHSAETADTLKRYESIEATDGHIVSIKRECEEAILAAALEESFLIVGEPGAGKSGVLNSLARELRTSGHDVLELAVDRHSVETLEGLKNDLGLEHGLIETLDAWDGAGPGWLIIDALDAARGGKGEGVFRSLIERVMGRKGRWRVIASIRTFDLRMGQQFRTLFRGTPPISSLQAQGLQTVRHVQIPPWSPTEFQQLLDRTPALKDSLEHAPPVLRALAAVPFNTRLLCEMLRDGLVSGDFSRVASQAELLKLYWDHRVIALGAPAQACIHRVVNEMVENRILRAAFISAAGNDPATLDALESRGVLISLDNRRWIQFRHHLLFDFAAANVLLVPGTLVDGTLRFSKADARGLLLAPALAFVLSEIWDADTSRAQFWTAAAHILADQSGDPVIRSTTGRICSEYPLEPADLGILAQRVVAGDKDAAQVLVHLSGALAIRLEDHPEMTLAPWGRLLHDLSANVAPVSGTVRFLLYHFLKRTTDEENRNLLGTAARALLSYALTLDSPYKLAVSAIDLVGATFATEPAASCELLERVFDPARLERFASDEVPALCRKIELIAKHDPAFAQRIYQNVFGYVVTEQRETKMSDSQILSLTSTARQDYEMAYYALTEFAPKFLALHAKYAVEAIIKATEIFVAHKHPLNANQLNVEVMIGTRTVRLREDWSYMWAPKPDETYHHDGEALVKKLLDYLRTGNAAEVTPVVERIIEIASLAIFWSRLFIVASERRDNVLDLVLPMAMREVFLTLPDTRKDAIDAVAAGYDRLSESARREFEVGVPAFDFSRFQHPEGARASFERRLFGAIGRKRLLTDYARSIAGEPGGADDVRNERLFTIRTISEAPEPYHWIQDFERELPANQSLMAAIDTVKGQLELERDSKEATPIALGATLDVLELLVSTIDRKIHNLDLVIIAEGQIARALDRLINQKETPTANDLASTKRFLALLTVIATSQGPRLHEDTEESFERNPSWGSPAPRVDAAKIALDLNLVRPDLYPELGPLVDDLLHDPHPAVRLEAALHLLRIWEIDNAGFWQRLSAHIDAEFNQGVLDHVIPSVLGRVLHEAPDLIMQIALELLDRFKEAADRQARMRNALAGILAILWVTHEQQAAYEVIVAWIAVPADHLPELSKVLGALRGAFVAGLDGKTKDDEDALRHRSQALALAIAEAADRGLAAFFAIEVPDESTREQVRMLAQILDAVCHKLYFASGASRNAQDTKPAIGEEGLRTFFVEVAETLEVIGNNATPHTIYYLLQLMEFLLPVDAARAFDLTAHALRSGGRKTGYQFESLGADLLVKLIGVFLADYKQLFDDKGRRDALIECLEIFMNAGWPAARRLLYRLPSLLQ